MRVLEAGGYAFYFTYDWRERLALELKMSAENYRHYESGRNTLKFDDLPRIARVFGLSVAQLASRLSGGE